MALQAAPLREYNTKALHRKDKQNIGAKRLCLCIPYGVLTYLALQAAPLREYNTKALHRKDKQSIGAKRLCLCVPYGVLTYLALQAAPLREYNTKALHRKDKQSIDAKRLCLCVPYGVGLYYLDTTRANLYANSFSPSTSSSRLIICPPFRIKNDTGTLYT